VRLTLAFGVRHLIVCNMETNLRGCLGNFKMEGCTISGILTYHPVDPPQTAGITAISYRTFSFVDEKLGDKKR
jgi:hypothetical protein